MNQRLVAAEAALKAGRRPEAIGHLIEALSADPEQNVQVYRVLVRQLYEAGRFEEGAEWAGKAIARAPKDLDLLNYRGVMLRKTGRQREALAVFDRAIKAFPKAPALQV